MNHTIFYATLRHKLCLACKRKLPEDYEFAMCCDGRDCGCHGLPTEPWTCSKPCDDMAWEYNWHDYRYMWGQNQ